MAEKRRYPGSMEGSALGSHGGTDFSLDEDSENKSRRRVPRTRRSSLSSEYAQVKHEIEEESPKEEKPLEFSGMEEHDIEALITEIPQASKQRIHQSLIQELGKMEFPAPRHTWEDSILELIEPQIHILIEAELHRMRATVAEQVNTATLQKYAEQIAAQITPEIEKQIREKMWVEFEELWKQREAGEVQQE